MKHPYIEPASHSTGPWKHAPRKRRHFARMLIALLIWTACATAGAVIVSKGAANIAHEVNNAHALYQGSKLAGVV